MGCYAPQAFKLRCMSTWNKQCIKKQKEEKFIWIVWNKAIAINVWGAKVDNAISKNNKF